jgi:hypothetical protein
MQCPIMLGIAFVDLPDIMSGVLAARQEFPASLSVPGIGPYRLPHGSEMQVLSITVAPTMLRKVPQPESASGNQQSGVADPLAAV